MENLCLANGSWVDSRVVDLYPWDAGGGKLSRSYLTFIVTFYQAPTRVLDTMTMAIWRFPEKQFTGDLNNQRRYKSFVLSPLSILLNFQDYLQPRQQYNNNDSKNNNNNNNNNRITSCNPDNNASPFYDPTCAPVKPVARLHILKQRWDHVENHVD